MLVDAQFSEDELSAPSGSIGGLGICNILISISIIFVSSVSLNKAQLVSLSVTFAVCFSTELKILFLISTILLMVQLFME